MSRAASIAEQEDIFALLASAPDFAQVAIFAETPGVAGDERGATETDVDNALLGRVRGQKRGGIAIIVTQPAETPDAKSSGPLIGARRHVLRIIETPEVCRKSGGPKDANGDGFTADRAKDLVMQRLHARRLGIAELLWSENKPWRDDKGGYGWEVEFTIFCALPTEARAAEPIIAVSAGVVTLTGKGVEHPGEQIFYTLDGKFPVPGTGIKYTEPFAVASGTRIRAAAIADGRELGPVAEGRAD